MKELFFLTDNPRYEKDIQPDFCILQRAKHTLADSFFNTYLVAVSGDWYDKTLDATVVGRHPKQTEGTDSIWGTGVIFLFDLSDSLFYANRVASTICFFPCDEKAIT